MTRLDNKTGAGYATKKAFYLLVFALLVCAPGIVYSADPPRRTAREILDHVDDLFRGVSSHGKLTMKVVTAHYAREMTLEEWSKGKQYSLIRILSPLKEQGTATLKMNDSVWNYLPKVKRVIKVPSSMMGGSWMGSHFTHDDLVKESRMADDYNYQITFQGARDGASITELTLVPRENSAVVWGKVVATIREPDLMPLRILYHDEDLRLARTMVFSDYRKVGGRLLPARMRITPTDKPAEYTEIIYHEIAFDLALDDGVFSLQNLQK